jgi:hypothetical protein
MTRRRSWPFPTPVIPRLRWSFLWLQKRHRLVAFYHGWFLQNTSGDPGEIDDIAHRLPGIWTSFRNCGQNYSP